MRLLGWWSSPAAEPPRLPRGLPAGAALRERAAARVSERRRGPGGWVEPVLEWNRRLGASAELLERARDILSGAGAVVVTGQQPALLGGPLYTLYKLLTAVDLAETVERETGRPCLAVFWIVGDDSDFGEVSWTLWPRPDGSVSRLRDESGAGGGALVGLLPAAARQGPLLADPMLFDRGPEGARRRARLEAALETGESWSGALATLAHAVAPGLSAIFVDGADPAVVAAQTPWLARAAEWPLASLLARGAEEAAAAGHAPALDPSLGDRALFRVRGAKREPLAGPVAEGERLAPNVILRPLVQDLLLPNVATVCGPSELRYRAQLGPLYRQAGLAEPILCPRLRAVLVRETGLDAARIAEDDWLSLREPDAWLDRLASAELPEALRRRCAGLRLELPRRLEAMGEELSAFDSGLVPLFESARGKIDYQLRRLQEGMESKARQRLYRRHPLLARWREFVRPREADQERSLNLLAPWLLEEEPRLEPLREAVAAHLRRVAAGEPESTAVLSLEAPPPEAAS